MRDYYIGITIGPIIETLSCASRPAALWCASSMLYKIDLYRPILTAALKKKMELSNAFKNLFDSEYHETVGKYISTVCNEGRAYADLQAQNITNLCNFCRLTVLTVHSGAY